MKNQDVTPKDLYVVKRERVEELRKGVKRYNRLKLFSCAILALSTVGFLIQASQDPTFSQNLIEFLRKNAYFLIAMGNGLIVGMVSDLSSKRQQAQKEELEEQLRTGVFPENNVDATQITSEEQIETDENYENEKDERGRSI
jgi:hypothetical protein